MLVTWSGTIDQPHQKGWRRISEVTLKFALQAQEGLLFVLIGHNKCNQQAE